MTGYSEIQLLATTSTAITHPDDRARTDIEPDGLADGTEMRWATDKRYRAGTGEDVWVHFAVSVVHDAEAPRRTVSLRWRTSPCANTARRSCKNGSVNSL